MNDKEKQLMKSIEKNIENLSKLNNYDTEKLLYSLEHMTKELLYFYAKIAKNQKPDNIIYKLKNRPKEHQLIYVNLGRGFPKELNDGHWCYVYKNYGYKLLVIPATSIKKESRYNSEFDLDIISSENENTVISRLSITDMRVIDIQRIDERKKYKNVLTDRHFIEKFIMKKMF